MNYWVDSWAVWVSAFCVLAIYSYLIRDNVLYRTMMQVFIGINVGYNVIVQWRDILYPRWWLPMLDGFDALFRGGPGSPWGALWILVGVLGLLWYFQLSRKYLWLSRIVIGITIGIGAGLTFKSQLGQNMPQVADSFKPLGPAIVAPQPRRLFTLPGSSATPAVDDPVAYFLVGTELVCVETLSGVEVWRKPLRTQGPMRVVDGLVVIGEGGSAEAFDRAGTEVAPPTARAPAANRYSITDDEGVPTVLEVVERGGFVHVVDPKTDKERWAAKAQGVFVGAEEGYVFVSNSKLNVYDGTDGKLLNTWNTAAPITSTPRFARYADPIFDRSVLMVPTETGVQAYAVREIPVMHREAGELLWSAPADEAVASLTPMKGAVLVQGRTRSELWDPPQPTPNIQPNEYFDNWVFVATMLSVMSYFFFSFKMEGKAFQGVSKFGRWMLMIGFGAFFGNTVMTRMSYLLDRLMFLIDEWLRPFIHHLFG